MQITFLGTSSGTPSRTRNVSSVALRLESGEVWLFDCGEGTQHRLQLSNLRASRIRRIFITHLHGDHVLGLVGLLNSLGLAGDPGRVDVYGPDGIDEFLAQNLRLTHTHLAYPVQAHVVSPGLVYEDAFMKVRAAELRHVVKDFGYRVEEKPRPGRLDAARAAELGVPNGPLLGRLKAGEDVELEDGRVIRGADLRAAPEPGRVFAYLTDTAFCEASVELARDADLVVHEATYTSADMVRMPDRLHSTAAIAAEVARRAGAHRLVLTHFSPRYLSTDEHLAEARAIFPETIAAEDLSTVEVPRRRVTG